MINIKYYSFVRPDTGDTECFKTIEDKRGYVKLSVPLYDYGLAEKANIQLQKALEEELGNIFPDLKGITKEEYLEYARNILSEKQFNKAYGSKK